MKKGYSKNLNSFYPWGVVVMLWFICFLNYADRQVISAIFPVLEQEFGFSKFQLGMIGSIFMWAYAGVVFFAGYASDRVARKPVILGGCLFWSLVTFCTGWCSLFWQFLTVRALEGLGEAFYFPSSNALLTDYHPKKNHSTVLACHQSGMYIGIVAGSSLGAWLAQHYGWRYGFYFFGGGGVLLSLVLFFFLKEPKFQISCSSTTEAEKLKASCHQVLKLSPGSTFFYLLAQPPVLLLILAFICAHFVAAIFLTWMPTFLYEKFHMTLALAGCSAVIFIQLAGAVSAPCSGWLADRLAARVQNGRVLLQLFYLLLGASAIFVIGKATTSTMLVSAMIGFGICKGGYDCGVFASLFDYVDPALRGVASGLISSCGWIGGALGPLIVGIVATYGGASEFAINRMSATISASAGAYLLGALFLMSAIFVTRKKSALPCFIQGVE